MNQLQSTINYVMNLADAFFFVPLISVWDKLLNSKQTTIQREKANPKITKLLNGN